MFAVCKAPEELYVRGGYAIWMPIKPLLTVLTTGWIEYAHISTLGPSFLDYPLLITLTPSNIVALVSANAAIGKIAKTVALYRVFSVVE
jgi:hypothetical protein